MWAPVDIAALPTANETINAKIAIRQVESELKDALLSLEQAQLRVANLVKVLNERRAWIAPVRRLSYDVLSLIFEFCGEVNWRTPLRISGVSRQWRHLVLATSRAWAFLPVHECKDEDLIRHFFQHSGHRPLRLALRESHRYHLLSGVVGRLERLWILDSRQVTEGQCFPRLELLSISSRNPIAITDLRISRFPALRRLIFHPAAAIISFPNSLPVTLPPLQYLSITMVGGAAWLDLLSGCKNSLLSLKLHDLGRHPGFNHQIVLPSLKCLAVRIWNQYPVSWPMELKTPTIQIYIEETRQAAPPTGTTPIHRDIGNAARIRVFYALNLSAMSSLRTLQLEVCVRIYDVLIQLQRNRSLCPRLELIEVLQAGDLAPYKTSLADVNKERILPISIRNVETWTTDARYEMPRGA